MSLCFASDSDQDDDMDTVNSILKKSGASPMETSNDIDSDSESSSGSDVQDWFRQIQDKFSMTSAEVVPFSDDDDEDDVLETMAAIHNQYQSQSQPQPQPQNEISDILSKNAKFPTSAQHFVDALNKNRTCQRFIRRKLMEIEAKIEDNNNLKKRVKCLLEFQLACKRKAGCILGQKKDPRVRLIAMLRKKPNVQPCKKVPASYLGPDENSRVSRYKAVMESYLVSYSKKRWSDMEKENLAKGLKQQYQEMLLLNSMNLENDIEGSMNPDMMSVVLRNDVEITPETIRSFLTLVNWDRLASMYVRDRSGAECESRWLNCEDPLIDHRPWTKSEDKKLLFIVQERGIYNWIDIAVMMGTRRTPFQCLVRYQRSLNPHILNRVWTKDEDAMLLAAVEIFGDKNWQLVASNIEGRTGTQCSTRWRKTLHPDRTKQGRWSVDEDKRLKVAVMLFGAKNWNMIARFVPGRTQVQCRERWLNCLDPSLKLEPWSEEEDAKLLAAIAEHSYRWSKVATCVPPRTDNQCMRRWKILCKREVPLLQEARRLKRTVLILNFVDRESERPSIGPSDFSSLVNLPVSECENSERVGKKRSRGARNENQREASCGKQIKKSRAKSRRSPEEDSSTAAENSCKKSRAKSRRSPHEDSSAAAENSCTPASGTVRRSRKKTSRNDQPNKFAANSLDGNITTNGTLCTAEIERCDISIGVKHSTAVNGRTKSRTKQQIHNQPDKSRTEFRQSLEIIPENRIVSSSDIDPTRLSFVPGIDTAEIGNTNEITQGASRETLEAD